MCHFGPRRKKQYHVHWKGYSNAKDTWEPEENVHAPELIAQYYGSQEMNIRATRMEMKNNMIRAGHLVPPREHFSFPRLSSPSLTSKTSNSELAKAYTKLRADQAISNVILKLEKVAQHSEMKLQGFPEEMGETSSLFDLGTQTQRNQDYSNPEHHTSGYRRAIPHPRNVCPCNTEEADHGQRLLSDPVVNQTDALGRIPLTMANNNNQEAPDPPWFIKPVAPNIPSLAAINQFGQTIELPYLQYGLINNKPFLLGTTGRSGEVYGEHLKAFLMSKLPFESHINNEALEALYTDHTFNWTLNLALYHMGDAGILADVHQYRTSYLKLKHLQDKNACISRILLVL
jgi:hypothetical protein